MVDRRQIPLRKLDVDNRADDLYDLTDSPLAVTAISR
jgi:hypothetical protein